MKVRPRLRLTHILVFVLVGLLVLSGAVLGQMGVSRAGDILEDNWRGAYDILVTHEDGFERITPGRDANGFSLVDNNYAAQTSRVIGFDQLEQIDAIESVELAAPVAFIGRLSNIPTWIYFSREKHNFEEEPIQDYEISWKVEDDNGVIFERTNNLRIDASRWTGEDGWYTDIGISLINDFAPPDRHLLLVQAAVFGDELLFTWGQGPTVATTIAAVDPERERELLGASAEFLQPLADFDELIRDRGMLTAREAFGATGTDVIPELEGLPGVEPGFRPVQFQQFGADNPMIGYVRNTDAYGSTRITASIDGLGEVSLDYEDVMRPFSGSATELRWPGDEPESDDPLIESYALRGYTATRTYPPQLVETESPVEGQAAFEARMLGIYGAFPAMGGDIDLPNGKNQGDEISYRNPTGLRLTVGPSQREGAAPFEVSSFTPGEVETEGGYVPLGLYGPNTATFEGEPFPPSRHGLGIAAQAPSAIVSFDGAELITAESKIISAVRVRVNGIDGLSNDDALTRLNDTAQAIRRIDGLDATLVIGGTTQPVNIWVPAYAHGTDNPEGEQIVDELGWIQQEYGTLGVASWTAALTNTTVDRVAIASILLTSLFVIGLSLLARQERRTTHAILASQGWSTGDRLKWTLREDWPGLAVFGAASAAALIIASNPLIRYAILAATGGLILGLIIANPVRARRLAPADRLGTRSGMIGLAAAEGVSLGITSAAIGAVGMMLHWYYRLVTQTSLGAAMTQALLPVLAAILVAGAVVVMTTAVMSQKSREAMSARNDFTYWNLGRSKAKIRILNVLPALLHVVIAATLILLGRLYTASFQDDDTVYLILAGAWILIWFISRATSALRWKPNIDQPVKA